MKHLIQKYILFPLRALVANPSILLLVLVVIFLDRINGELQSKTGISLEISQLQNADYIFNQFPEALFKANNLKLVSFGFLLLTIFQAIVTVIIMTDLKFIYLGKRTNLQYTLRHINKSDICWFLGWEIIVYLAFGILGSFFYSLSYYVWNIYSLNTTLLLMGSGVMAFPLFYSLLSIGAKIAVVQATWKEKLKRMLYLGKPKNLLRVYIFYPIRLGVEVACFIVIPAFVLALTNNRLVAFIAGTIALLIPLATFRISTFEFFLSLYEHDMLVYTTYQGHFQKQIKSISSQESSRGLIVRENEGYEQYVKMMQAFLEQPEYIQFLGRFWRFILYGVRWPLYHIWRKKVIVKRITVEKDGKVLGGFELSLMGELGSAVVTTVPTYRISVIKVLLELGDELLQDKTKTFTVRTFNTVIISTLTRRGFYELPDRRLYVVTIPLGPLTFTWNRKSPPKFGKSFLKINKLIYLTRPSEIQNN